MKKIAIIEDNQEIREMYGLKLEIGGYQIVSAENGESGLEVLKKEKPDLLLLDIMLPKKDGYDVMKEMKNDGSEIKNIPVIILSNLSGQEDFFEAKKLGAVDFFVKAKSTPADILDKVNLFFAGGAAASFSKSKSE